MSVNMVSDQRARRSPQQNSAVGPSPSGALAERWGSRVFYLFSALLHIAVAIGLSTSFRLETAERKTQAGNEKPSLQKPAVARMAIDVGPIKFCEMTIDQIIGRSRSQATPELIRN